MNCETKTNDRKILSEVNAACEAVNEAAQRVLPGMPGLANYYETRLEHGEMLTEPERFLLIYIATMFPRETRVVEIAAGAAQLSSGLALLGFTEVWAIEIDIYRAALAKALCEAVCAGKVNVVLGAWQKSELAIRRFGASRALLVTWNAVSSLCSKDGHQEAKTFQRWWDADSDIILCPRLYATQDDLPMPIDFGKPLPYELFHYRR